MANNNDANENRWVDERLRSLETPELEPNYDAARGRLRERDTSARTTRRRWTTAAAIGAAILLLAALPWPRAAAQRLWDRLSLGRIEVVRVAQENLPQPVNPFDWKEDNDEPVAVRDAAEAERVAGFRPLLPPTTVVRETPRLTVSKRGVMSATVRVADLERALAAEGVAGVHVPNAWEGVMLRVERGIEIDAVYDDAKMGLSQSPPFKLVTPSGFPVGEFMEVAYRLYGKSAMDARELSRKFVANPAWMLVFPGHDTVQEVSWKGGRAVAAGGGGSMCFFWNTSDRLFILGAQKMDPGFGVAVANSLR
jgi:hypothetical protein